MGSDTHSILIVAGEASGDQAAATLVSALRELRPGWRIWAVGGPLMEAAGAELILPYDDLAVMGFTEVLTSLPRIWRRYRELRRLLRSGMIDLFLPVDFPGFNLRLARVARKAGVPVLYFVAPQVWAWHRSRVATMLRVIDRLALILPFEKAWFAAEGMPAEFVGHPIMETERPRGAEPAQAGAGANASDEAVRHVALMPGSRRQEVERLLPLCLETARLMEARRPGLVFHLLESPTLPAAFYDELLESGLAGLSRSRVSCAEFLGDMHAALVASGTATLETAVADVPMLVVYRTGRLNYFLARRLITLDDIALVNLVAGRRVVPEFVQDDAQADALAAGLLDLLEDGESRLAQKRAFAKIRADLGGPGCGRRVAELAIALLEVTE